MNARCTRQLCQTTDRIFYFARRYHQQIGKLIELYSFNDRELLGLHVMSVERLKGLE